MRKPMFVGDPAPPPGLDWLAALIVSWAVPIVLAQTRRFGYLQSLAFWVIPVMLLFWRFVSEAQPDPQAGLGYSRRRRAFVWAVGQIVALGALLDFGLGAAILQFHPDRSEYLLILWRGIPVEELLFYALGPMAILLVYVWCDDYWLAEYSHRKSLRQMPPEMDLFRLSPSIFALGVGLIAAGIMLKSRLNPKEGPWLPMYFTFLVLLAFLPAALLYPRLKRQVNWRAFSFTTLYVLTTSVIWEATLAIPRRWWGYRPAALLGLWVPDWSRSPDWPFPVEAALVWLGAPFSCILVYEAHKFYQYNPNPHRLQRLRRLS